ncbi:nuclear transport factor 2 family protein [Paraburkholderia sp. CNPSo 3272]|uniref:YybH family protein n=1 Tax=Paraburkholderia sp. CNPSo 3272 TaxID=2940931 RepID=UPI0020B7ADB1|nr:nuclear transport factor 2 family protein [Paraburkholderia sp. CNPSo 3272]MCP3723405.1 nuclear transport factor 2 family protein [Paraburkholderia sp. CNPSo 3272]
MDRAADPILQVLHQYKAAVLAKDVDAFVALYDPDIRAFDMWGAWTYEGIASWRNMVEGWFGSLGAERVIVDFSEAHTTVSQDLAVVHAFVSYKAVAADGEELRSMDNRVSATLRQTVEGWKIFHQHSSSPIDPATTKVIFKR